MRLPWQSPDDHRRDLLLKAQAGNRDAFRALYLDLYDPVARFVARRVRHRDDAEDLVSKVFHGFLEHLQDVDPKRGTVRMFVLAMARNAVIDYLRTRRAQVPIDEVASGLLDEGKTPVEAVLEMERLRALRAAISELSPEAQELLMLRHGDGLKHGEIAELCGETTETIKQRLSRVQRVLRERLEAVEPADPAGSKGDLARVRL